MASSIATLRCAVVHYGFGGRSLVIAAISLISSPVDSQVDKDSVHMGSIMTLALGISDLFVSARSPGSGGWIC
eukprot:5086817-Amphidinium_carterae.1